MAASSSLPGPSVHCPSVPAAGESAQLVLKQMWIHRVLSDEIILTVSFCSVCSLQDVHRALPGSQQILSHL